MRDEVSWLKALLENADIRVYAHDMSAVPGKVYRYRVRVVCNNPYFGKDIMLRIESAPQMPDDLLQLLYNEKEAQKLAAEEGIDLPAGGSPWDVMVIFGFLLMAGGVWIIWMERRKPQN